VATYPSRTGDFAGPKRSLAEYLRATERRTAASPTQLPRRDGLRRPVVCATQPRSTKVSGLSEQQILTSNRSLVLVDPADIPTVLEPHGLRINPVITQPQVSTSGISAGVVEVPPACAARAHQHRDTDVIVVVTGGHALTLWGEELENEIHQDPGQFLHIPAPIPHAVVNLSADTPIYALEFRADADFSRDMHLLPHLQEKVRTRAKAVPTRDRF
jgi:uncharacterized RmlC-like cupin family protein